MRRRRSAPRTRKTTRRWHIPPPLVHGPEALEGGSVLEEIQTDLGALLWQALRDVMLWADTAPEERAELFPREAATRREASLGRLTEPVEIMDALRELGTVLERPETADAVAVSRACDELSRWAERRDALQTALAF